MNDIERRQIKIDGDISYIKAKIDNGISTSIKEILQAAKESCLDRAEIRGRLDDHSFWVGILKKAVVIVTSVAIVGGVSAVFYLANLKHNA